jgi:transposase
VALALHEAGHVVSVVNPAQIRDFARTKLGRNKTDKVDAALICEYAELFKPEPWTPPSPAMRRLCELQTMRAGIIRSRAEWKNRIGSGLGDSTETKLAAATLTISPANSRRSTGPLARLSSRTPNCAADATCCSASSVSAIRWPPR